MRHAFISGTGSYLPEKALTNQELETCLDTTHEWIYTRTGISERRIASAHETTSYMASQAAIHAVESARISADDLDLIIVATSTPEHYFPGTACHVQKALNISKATPAFDISAACSGFMYALDMAKQYILAGTANHVLVIGAEKLSGALDWTDRSSCVLFGDGAGAVVLSAAEKPGILGSVLHAAFDEGKLLSYAAHNQDGPRPLIGMRGNEIFKIAVNVMCDIVDEVLSISRVKQSDIQWLVPHQANIRIIQAIAKKLALPMSQVITTIEHQGNTSAASIPLALDISVREKRIKRGDLLLLESFGGGMTWGAMVIRY